MSLDRWGLAVAGSGLLHALLALSIPPAPEPPALPDWRESVMIELPPPPEPVEVEAPEPPPPEPPPPAPEVVEYTETVAEPAPAPPTEAAPPVADAAPPIQGLSASSFSTAPTATGLTVRAGTTLQAAATTAALPEAVERPDAIQWSDAPRRPRCRPPRVKVPASIIDAGLEGEVRIRMDIDAEGAVSRVAVTEGLSADADAACVAAWQAVTCRPARRDRTPVAVANMPHSCLFQAVN